MTKSASTESTNTASFISIDWVHLCKIFLNFLTVVPTDPQERVRGSSFSLASQRLHMQRGSCKMITLPAQTDCSTATPTSSCPSSSPSNSLLLSMICPHELLMASSPPLDNRSCGNRLIYNGTACTHCSGFFIRTQYRLFWKYRRCIRN